MRKILVATMLAFVPAVSALPAAAADLAEATRDRCRSYGFPSLETGFEQCAPMVRYQFEACAARGFDGGGVGFSHCIELGLARERAEGIMEAQARGVSGRTAIAEAPRSR